MPKITTQVPKLCRHTRGQAFIKVNGQQVWLGRYGDPLTQEKYDRLIAQWLSNGRALPAPPPSPSEPITVLQILAPYWHWAKSRYFGGEMDNIKAALRIAEKLYGSVPAVQFGPNALRVVRAEMIRKGWTRKQINRQISRVRALFRWAASHELLHESVYNQLRTVEPLHYGEAPERPRVKPVARPLIRAARHGVSRQIRTLIDLQLLTAARADELAGMRAGQIDRSRPVWTYRPEHHKTVHREKERCIYFGPRAQKILKLFLVTTRASDAYLFSPREAEQQRHALARRHRRASQRPNPKKTNRLVGDRYTTGSYRRAIHRALALKYPAPKTLTREEAQQWRRDHTWGPHRLRHNAATFLRREFGIEIARSILGHSSAVTTLIYAEQNESLVVQAMAKVG